MQPLLDSDILLYEIGFSSQKEEEVDGQKVIVPSSWDFCRELVDNRIALICDEVRATTSPLLYLTNTKYLNKHLNKQRKRENVEQVPYVENFRMEVAKEKSYKAGRKPEKPFHFSNLVHHLLSSYSVVVNEHGLEADDAMCIEQYARWKSGAKDTIICSRDKDLRQCPGWHYSWEVGKQSSIGPIEVDELGYLEKKDSGKIFGVGSKFFYYQLVVGDSVDNIGGLKGRGPVFGYNLLKDAASERECYELVAELYVKFWGDVWKEKMEEQCDLLWMIREINESGDKVRWRVPVETP